MTAPLSILGLESSCDDTAAAVLRVSSDDCTEVLASVVDSQVDLHREFGGVVPEIAARAHVEKLDLCTKLALDRAGLRLGEVDLIAVTAGPGLIGGVMAGVLFAKGLSAALNKPLIGVNHLAGHALPRCHRKRKFFRRPVGHDQIAPQCGRSAREDGPEAG